MNSQITKIDNGWLKSIKTLMPMINVLHGLPSSHNVDKFHDMVADHLLNRGSAETIKKLKAYRLVLQQFALKQTIVPVPFCKADRDSFPKVINFIKPVADDVYSIRYSFSVMRIIETFRCEPEYSVNTITDNSLADENLLKEITDYIHDWSFLRHMPKLGPPQLVMSNRAGPNGPATITAIQDLAALRLKEPLLLESIKELLLCNSGYLIPDAYETHKDESLIASKLVLLSDNACKTRVIAIADWWSNTALSSLHKGFMVALRKLPSDVTYIQSDIPKLVKSLGSNLYSSDMTAFTDRFPRKLEVELVKAAYGADMSRLWEQITTNRTFHHPKGDVRYNCGNPMGLLSSWPVSTLTHHAVKQYCANKVNVRNYKYLILGDDTLDTSKEVYKEYTNVISRLGVSLSLSKCTQSKQGYTEFAKRLFIKQNEVTGLPVNILKDARTRPEQILQFVKMARERGYEDSFLRPTLVCFLSTHKQGKQISDMLSLPYQITSTSPLLEVVKDSWASKLLACGEDCLEDLVSIARNYVFWTTAIGINKPNVPKKVCQVPIDSIHPLVFGVTEQLAEYQFKSDLSLEFDDDYSIYNSWMKGEYREMANVPNLDTYRYYNKGHYATKCKYDVLNALLAIANGDTKISLHKPTRLSNLELFSLAFNIEKSNK